MATQLFEMPQNWRDFFKIFPHNLLIEYPFLFENNRREMGKNEKGGKEEN